MTPAEVAAWEKIGELASRFQSADRIVMGVPMWNFSLSYKLKQLIDLSCQRNMLFTFDGKRYGPSLDIEKAFVAFVRGQSDEAGFETVPQPGFQHLSGYVEFWLRFIGVREVVTLTLEHTWDGRAVEITALVVREVGKPLSEARGEVARGVAILRYYAQAALLPDGETIPAAAADQLLLASRHGRRHRPAHAVELPGRHSAVEGRPQSGLRQRDHPQAVQRGRRDRDRRGGYRQRVPPGRRVPGGPRRCGHGRTPD